MRRLLLIAGLLGTHDAHADDDIDLELHEGSPLTDPGPRLHIDPVLRPNLEGLGAVRESERTYVPVGKDSLAILEGTWWANVDSDDPRRPARLIDIEGRGWTAGLRFQHDLGFATFEAFATMNHVGTRYGSGTYRDVGVALVRRWRLSRWMTAWIALTVGHRTWLGDKPPAGEANATQATLSIGTTFR